MKNKLSNSHNELALSERSESKGFTLVELLVVITILAILSTLAMIIYSSVQGRGRDTVRRAEIDNIANAIESKRNNNGTYTFTTTDLQAEFQNGSNAYLGKDPSGIDYVIAVNTGGITPPVDPRTDLFTVNFPPNPWPPPTTGAVYDELSTVIDPNVPGLLSENTVKAWKVCTKLEAGINIYCRSSLTR